jgi:hypothetical protein
MAPEPPAITAATNSGGVEKVGGHSEASTTASRPAVDRGGDGRQLGRDRLRHLGILAVHQAGQLQGRAAVDVGEPRIHPLGGQSLQARRDFAIRHSHAPGVVFAG